METFDYKCKGKVRNEIKNIQIQPYGEQLFYYAHRVITDRTNNVSLSTTKYTRGGAITHSRTSKFQLYLWWNSLRSRDSIKFNLGLSQVHEWFTHEYWGIPSCTIWDSLRYDEVISLRGSPTARWTRSKWTRDICTWLMADYNRFNRKQRNTVCKSAVSL